MIRFIVHEPRTTYHDVMGAFLQARRIALERVELIFDSSRDDHKNHLDHLLGTPLLVPEILTISNAVRGLISQPNPIAAREQNEILEEVARAIPVDVIYLLDLSGKCLAASNWRAQDSFVGHNYGFRPYFQQAITGRTGRYTAKGVTSLKMGHYLARPVTVDGEIRGAVVAKISFDSMRSRVEEVWHRDGGLASDWWCLIWTSSSRSTTCTGISPGTRFLNGLVGLFAPQSGEVT